MLLIESVIEHVGKAAKQRNPEPFRQANSPESEQAHRKHTGAGHKVRQRGLGQLRIDRSSAAYELPEQPKEETKNRPGRAWRFHFNERQ